jgi:spore germination cell wall hydrolase CwlJ-like protein
MAALLLAFLVAVLAWAVDAITDRVGTAGQLAVDLPTPTEQPAAILTITTTPTATPGPSPEPARYELTDAERELIASVVMAEAGGEPFAGQVAVAQCILNASERDGIRPDEAVAKYKYTTSRPESTDSVMDAVAAVFDNGWYVTTEPILYFYAPDRVASDWHESQRFVIRINGHRFFAEATKKGE